MEEQSFFPTRKAVGTMQLVDPAAVAAAEAAKAQIQAAYIVAMQKPRNQMQARSNILMACKRTEFAEKAEYSKPVGKHKITGPSVRFAELAIREWENVRVETVVLYEDDDVKRLRVSAIDLETNAQFSRDIQIKKTIERRSKKGREEDVISERKNTYGDVVYILRATDDEMLTKESAWVSKIIRNEGLRLIPTDIIEEGLKQARETLRSKAAMDPDGEKKKIVDAFAGIGIKPTQIEKYLGHDIGTIVPAEIAELRSMYRTIRDGEASWNDYMKTADQTERDPQEQTPPDNVTDLLKDRNGPSLYSGNSKSQQPAPSDSSKKVEKQETKYPEQKSNGTAPPLVDGMNEDQLWELLKENVASAGVKTPESFSKIEAFIHRNVQLTKKPIAEALRVAINTKPTDLMLKVTDWYARIQETNGQQSQLTDASRYSGANSRPPEDTRLDGLPQWNEKHPFWPDKWNKMRTGDGVKTGLAAYVHQYEKAIWSMPEDQQRELVAKFERIYKDMRFPFQLDWMGNGESDDKSDNPGADLEGQSGNNQTIDVELRAARSDLIAKKSQDEKLFSIATKNLFQKNAISTTFPYSMNLDECQAVVDEMNELAEMGKF
ncbi:hypothetical protein [Desulfosarcina variabilis]|uniref:hypothetical protein n=1 Tax=Desulfosarcina variabilis TaxID=2300 RepID=UPI003AFB65D5